MDIRYKIKSNKFLFKLHLIIISYSYRRGYIDFLRGRHIKSKTKIREEIDLLKDYWGCMPMHYFSYRLFDKELTKQDLINYVPYYYMYNIHIPQACVKIDIRQYENKISLDSLLRERGIPTPSRIALVKRGKIKDNKNKTIDFSLFKEILQESKANRFFLKPARGCGGSGIFIIEKKGKEVMMDGKQLESKALYKRFNSHTYIIQEGVKQREDFSLYNPSSINTLRVISQRIDGEIHISLVVLRIGRGHSFIDNASKGGLSVGVNVATGELNERAYILLKRHIDSYLTHPDTGLLFKGHKINKWETIKKDIKQEASKLQDLDEVSWDICICPEGISIIEINIFHGIDLLQYNCGGVREQLRINLRS